MKTPMIQPTITIDGQAIDQTCIDALRELRLWHWRGAKYRRDAEQFYLDKAVGDKKVSQQNAEAQAKQALFHIGQVQALNIFFDVPHGDTAENDLAKDEDRQHYARDGTLMT